MPPSRLRASRAVTTTVEVTGLTDVLRGGSIEKTGSNAPPYVTWTVGSGVLVTTTPLIVAPIVVGVPGLTPVKVAV